MGWVSSWRFLIFSGLPAPETQCFSHFLPTLQSLAHCRLNLSLLWGAQKHPCNSTETDQILMTGLVQFEAVLGSKSDACFVNLHWLYLVTVRLQTRAHPCMPWICYKCSGSI